MQDLFLARSWAEVRGALERDGIPYEVTYTRSPRKFFPTDASQLYVVRVRRTAGICEVLLAESPATNAVAAAFEAVLC